MQLFGILEQFARSERSTSTHCAHSLTSLPELLTSWFYKLTRTGRAISNIAEHGREPPIKSVLATDGRKGQNQNVNFGEDASANDSPNSCLVSPSICQDTQSRFQWGQGTRYASPIL
ncbi:hypothetical protein Plhal710r2_c016g0070801 [Plasmopara halstedii]